jgi:hypothetical protein
LSSSSSNIPAAPSFAEPSQPTSTPPSGLALELLAGRSGLRRTSAATAPTTTSKGSSTTAGSATTTTTTGSGAPGHKKSASSSGGMDMLAEMQARMKERRVKLQPQGSTTNVDANDWTP